MPAPTAQNASTGIRATSSLDDVRLAELDIVWKSDYCRRKGLKRAKMRLRDVRLDCENLPTLRSARARRYNTLNSLDRIPPTGHPCGCPLPTTF